jgi:hypothetical protein
LISRAAALLHSFGYEESRLAFNDAAKADPSCAMAHWGVARTWYNQYGRHHRPEELKQGTAAMDRALALDPKTGRERDYIQALSVFYKDWQTTDHATRAKNYERASAGVCERNPNDDEAAISTHCNSWLSGILDPTDKSYTGRRKAARFSTACCHVIRTIPAWRTTSFTVSIIRRWPSWSARQRVRMR